MLAAYTLLAATSFPQSGAFAFPLEAGEDYLFQTDNITRLKVYDSSDSEFTYLFGKGDRCSRATIRVDETYSTLVADAKKTQENKIIALTVLINEKGETLSSSETWYVNQDHILLAFDYKTDYTRVWVSKGGSYYETFVVQENLTEIVALCEAIG